MAYLLSGERPAVAAASLSPVAALLANLRKMLADRAQHRALKDLLLLEDARLEDLGITREDVRDALRAPPRQAAMSLSRKRAKAASLWLGR